MLWIKWAFKKIVLNIGKTVGKSLFFGIIFSVIFLLIMYLDGTDDQMQKSLRNAYGDANLISKNSDQDLSGIKDSIKPEFEGYIESKINIYNIDAEVNSQYSYSGGKCIGVEEGFSQYLDRSVGWAVPRDGELEEGSALIEASLAESLHVTKGDYIIVKYVSEEGMINTIDLTIDGVFVGSNLIFKNNIFMNIKDMWLLTLEEGFANELRLFFTPEAGYDNIRASLKDIQADYYKTITIQSVTLDPTGGLYGVYKYYNLLVIFVMSMVIVIFIVIINFSNQNLFFMEFRKRRAELSTLLTYGVKHQEIRYFVFWETLFLFISSLIVTALAALGITGLAGRFTITSVEISDLITAIGGPKLVFTFSPLNILIVLLILFIIMVYSALKGANNYLRFEIREIISTSE